MDHGTMGDAEYKILHNVNMFFQGERELGVVVPVELWPKRFRLATGVDESEIDTKSESERKLLENILKFIKDEASNGISSPVGFHKKRFLLATGYDVSTFKTPFKVPTTQNCTSPDINIKTLPDEKVVVQSSTICAINDIIQKREANTINKLLEVVTARLNFKTSCEVLREIVTEKLGYQIRVTGNKEFIIKTRIYLSHESIIKKLKNVDQNPIAIIDNLTKSKIRSIVQKLEARHMTNLLKEVRGQLDLDITIKDLSDIVVKNLGYRIINNNGLEHLMDNPMIAGGRAKYLRKMRENDELPAEKKRPVIYVGETILVPLHAYEFWDTKTNRWAIAHAGGDNGFVEGAAFVYSVKLSHSKDRLMDANEFSGWIAIELLRNLPSNSIIVISSTAAHHCHEDNSRPQMSSEKGVMLNWLSRNNIEYERNMTKKELFYLVRTACLQKVYTVDEMLKKFGHEVLRLPPFHDDLNAIEYVWRSVKNRMAEMQPYMKNPKDLCMEILKEMGVNAWKKEIEHVNKLRDTLWEIEMKEENQKLENILYDDSYPEFIADNGLAGPNNKPSVDNIAQIKDKLDEDIDNEEKMHDELAVVSNNPSVEKRIHNKEELDDDIDIEEYVPGAKIKKQCKDVEYEEMDDKLTGPSNPSVEYRIKIKEESDEDTDNEECVQGAEIIKQKCNDDEDEDMDDKLDGASNNPSIKERIQIKEELDEDIDIEEYILGTEM